MSRSQSHISLNIKKYCGNRCEFSDWSWAADYGFRSTCSCFSASCHRLLSGQAARRKRLFSRKKNRVSLYLQKKNRSPESSNCLSSGACAFILPLCRLYKVDMWHAQCVVCGNREEVYSCNSTLQVPVWSQYENTTSNDQHLGCSRTRDKENGWFI